MYDTANLLCSYLHTFHYALHSFSLLCMSKDVGVFRFLMHFNISRSGVSVIGPNSSRALNAPHFDSLMDIVLKFREDQVRVGYLVFWVHRLLVFCGYKMYIAGRCYTDGFKSYQVFVM